jgi:5'-methylthioadenosine phosphorylase/5'-methylthioinosine phosphorylase
MTSLAIIGGTGLGKLAELDVIRHEAVTTPYGSTSADFVVGEIETKTVIFLARHGNPHAIAPHKINYRANIWALKHLGVEDIIAVAAVGGITPQMVPAHVAIPNQIIDYTYGREHTFFDGEEGCVTHIDFTYPYSQKLRDQLISCASTINLAISPTATYGCTQGPRLETAAEIARMARDGCDVVGMTGMPEAVLAKELGMEYATVAVLANWGAGIVEGEITMAEIEENLHHGMASAGKLLQAFVSNYSC